MNTYRINNQSQLLDCFSTHFFPALPREHQFARGFSFFHSPKFALYNQVCLKQLKYTLTFSQHIYVIADLLSPAAWQVVSSSQNKRLLPQIPALHVCTSP